MNNKNFIGTYNLEHNICDDIVNFYNAHKDYAKDGLTTKEGVKIADDNFKESKDLGISAYHLYKPFDKYRTHLQSSLESYIETYEEVNNYSKFNILEDYNIQHYPVGGGFKQWHFEASHKTNIGRVLVFMTYLNDVPDGGTHFKYQNLTMPAKKGSTIIWPSGFTHTHKGQISQTKEKYIITGWWRLTNE